MSPVAKHEISDMEMYIWCDELGPKYIKYSGCR